VLPDLVGKDFEQARKELRDRRLGWRLVFGGAGTDRSVASTQPRAGTRLHPGLTVKVFVVGAAPSTPVPAVTGLSCAEAQAQIVDAGFYPEYPRGQNGQVTMQDPAPSAIRRWNDPVRLYCGSAPSGAPHEPGTPTP
jgi:beta-lactam-binding protein with PASTA domain